MNSPPLSDLEMRRLYQAWIEEQIEDFKAGLTRDELMEIADEALLTLERAPDGQYPLTEILLCDAVDSLLFDRLDLPTYRQWRRSCRNDTLKRPQTETAGEDAISIGSRNTL